VAGCDRLLDRAGPGRGRPDRRALVRLAQVFSRRKRLDRNERYAAGEATIFFVTSGLVRIFFTVGDGKDWTKEFVVAPDFGGPIAGRVPDSGFLVGVHALEASELVEAPYHTLKAVAAEDAGMGAMLVGLLEAALRRKALREKTLIYQTPAERYAALCQAEPDLVARVPQYHLASYLGVTDVALSRIKRRSARD